MDDWEKEDFQFHLTMEYIPDADYTHAKSFCKDFERKNLGQYHNLYVLQSVILLVADIFNNFNKCLEIYGLDPACSLSELVLVW